jgi:hypothetical protein
LHISTKIISLLYFFILFIKKSGVLSKQKYIFKWELYFSR